MNNNKQSSVEFIIESLMSRNLYTKELLEEFEQAKAMHEEELNVAYGNGYEQGEMDFYKKMQCKGDKYADGYSEVYKRALELVKYKIDNDLQ